MENSAKAEEHEKIFHKEVKTSLDSETESSFIINENTAFPDTSYAEIDLTSLIIWLVVVGIVSLADFFLPALMTRKFGGSKAGEWGATIGVFAGLFLFPPWGIILGPFFGAVLGEMSRKNGTPHQALKSGFGSFLAFFVGTGIKLIVAFWMTGVVVAACWRPVWEAIVSLF